MRKKANGEIQNRSLKAGKKSVSGEVSPTWTDETRQQWEGRNMVDGIEGRMRQAGKAGRRKQVDGVGMTGKSGHSRQGKQGKTKHKESLSKAHWNNGNNTSQQALGFASFKKPGD